MADADKAADGRGAKREGDGRARGTEKERCFFGILMFLGNYFLFFIGSKFEISFPLKKTPLELERDPSNCALRLSLRRSPRVETASLRLCGRRLAG